MKRRYNGKTPITTIFTMDCETLIGAIWLIDETEEVVHLGVLDQDHKFYIDERWIRFEDIVFGFGD